MQDNPDLLSGTVAQVSPQHCRVLTEEGTVPVVVSPRQASKEGLVVGDRLTLLRLAEKH